MPRMWAPLQADQEPTGACSKCGTPFYGGDPDPGEKCPNCHHPLEGGKQK
jgi:rubrerythrin